MSLEWARIEPEEGRFDEEAIGRYRREIALMTGRGIRPMVTLHHFSNPLWLEDAGGWENPRTVDRYLRYVERAVDALGDLVADWVTINEPSGYLVMGYVFGEWPPGKRKLAAALRAARNMVRAHAEAYHVIHETRTRVLDGAPAAVGATGDTGFGAAGVVGSGAPPDTDAGSGAGGSEPGGPSPTRVGVAHHLRLFEPARRANPLDHLAAAVFRRLNQDIFVHAMDEGALRRPLGGWPFARVDLPKARGPAGYLSDFFGINYYSRDLVRFAPGSAPLAARREVRPGSQTNDLGWEIYPEGLRPGTGSAITCRSSSPRTEPPMPTTASASPSSPGTSPRSPGQSRTAWTSAATTTGA
jgi:beta-glucosidase